MLIHPKAILAVSRAAATEASRYALNVIHVQRMADGVQLTATNGKYLLRSTTPEADAEELPAGAIGRYPAIGPEALFEGKLEPGAAVKAAKAAKGNKARADVLGWVGLDEGNYNGTATLETWANLSPTRSTSATPEGHFPPTDSIIPMPDEDSHVSVTLDPRMLRDVCEAIIEAADDGTKGRGAARLLGITLRVAREGGESKPVRIDGLNVIGSLVGVVMPITG